MLCPRCGKGRMYLRRIEYRLGEVVYIFECERCGYRLEVSHHVRTDFSWWRKWYWKKSTTPTYGRCLIGEVIE